MDFLVRAVMLVGATLLLLQPNLARADSPKVGAVDPGIAQAIRTLEARYKATPWSTHSTLDSPEESGPVARFLDRFELAFETAVENTPGSIKTKTLEGILSQGGTRSSIEQLYERAVKAEEALARQPGDKSQQIFQRDMEKEAYQDLLQALQVPFPSEQSIFNQIALSRINGAVPAKKVSGQIQIDEDAGKNTNVRAGGGD
jgi:hypothetical protein